MLISILPFAVNSECKVLDTVPVRTMICICVEGYQGNAAVQCDRSKYTVTILFSSQMHLYASLPKILLKPFVHYCSIIMSH